MLQHVFVVNQRRTGGSTDPQWDAYGRNRVSSPYTIFEVQHEYNDQPLIWNNTVVGAESAILHLPDESAVKLSTGGVAGNKAVRETKEYFRYQPGKSQLINLSGVIGDQNQYTNQRIGYFDDNDGVFFEVSAEDGLKVVVRSSTSGSVVDVGVLQQDWNIDKFDGTGPSGIVLDLATTQIFHIDLQWLGVGDVRFGFVVDGRLVYCHKSDHANVLTSAYMGTANLPVRYEIETVEDTGSVFDLLQICSTVISEGGFVREGFPFSVNNTITGLSVGVTKTPVISIRRKATFNSIANTGLIDAVSYNVFTRSQNMLYEIVHEGSLTSPTWTSVNSNSIVEYDTAASAISGGRVIESGFIPSGRGENKAGAISSLLSKLLITNTAPLTIVCQAITLTTEAHCSLNWRELY